MPARRDVVIVGGGFGGLAAADRLAQRGCAVTLLESESSLGGMAGAFDRHGTRIDKFYHHWFLSDRAILDWIDEMGWRSDVLYLPGKTGHYYANSIFKMSSPMDLLRFRAIPFADRLRVASMVLRARRIRDYTPLEAITARDWLIEQTGARAFEVLWEPLLRGKFGKYADVLAAAWFANKFKLRGSSARRGKSCLAYFRGGFGALLDRIRDRLESSGVQIRLGCRVESVASVGSMTARDASTPITSAAAAGRARSTARPATATSAAALTSTSASSTAATPPTGSAPSFRRANDRVAPIQRAHPPGTRRSPTANASDSQSAGGTGRVALQTSEGTLRCESALFTTALPPFLRMLPGDVAQTYADTAAQIPFLDNVCLVLCLERSLSDMYWVNVADPNFPFIGVIEHTNFDTGGDYGGHLVYLSKYLVPEHPMTRMSADELCDLAVPEIQRLFPDFDPSWIRWATRWHARHAQPIVVKNYRSLIPSHRTPLPGVYLSTMAQVYPEDRGTNYAVAYGRRVAEQMLDEMDA